MNLGWARANNQGLAAAGGRYVCLFNSDVSVNEPQWNRRAMQFLQRRANCCALGLSKTAGSAFFHTDGSHTGPPGQQPCITEAISGATLFADRRRTGDFRFDEAYPWWFEETDICFQWRAAGWKLMRLPLEIHHLGEQTVRRESDSQSRIEYMGRPVNIDALKHHSRDRFLKFWGHLLRDWTDPAEHARWLQAQAKPLVDVCMVTKGRAHLIRWAIESVAGQELQDWRLWIIDGDGNLQLPVVDPRIKVIGASWSNIPEARNLALQLGRADLIAWIDDDEWWAPDHLRRGVEFLEDSPDVDVAYTDMDRARGAFTTDGFQRHELLPDDWCRPFRLEDLERENFIPSGNVVGRREAFLRVGGYDEQIEVGEDYDLWLRMAWAGAKFAHLCTRRTHRRATAEYRLWGGNTTLHRSDEWSRAARIVRARQTRRKLDTAAGEPRR